MHTLGVFTRLLHIQVARKQAQIEAETAVASSLLRGAGKKVSAAVQLSEVNGIVSAEWSTEDQPYTSAQKTGRYPPNMGRITRASLKGPFNPHEVSFQSLTSIGRTKYGHKLWCCLRHTPLCCLENVMCCYLSMLCHFVTRSTRVAKDSVNCVTLNDEPQDNSDRMMVATHVAINPAGSAILVR